MNVAVRTADPRASWGAAAVERLRRVAASADARAVAGIALLVSALTALTWQKWGVPSIDAGHELTVADAIARGAEPYRDIRYFYGPAGVYTLGGAFALFGSGFTTAFAFGLAQTAAILGAFYALSRQLLSALPSFVATALLAAIGFSGTAFNFVLPHTNSATFGILFLLLMLLAICRERLILAGLAAGVVGLTRPEYAAIAALVCAAYLLGRGRQDGPAAALRALPALALPALLLAGGVLGVLAASAGAANLFTENLWPVDFLRVTHFGSQSDWAPLDAASAVATAFRAGIYCALLAAVTSSAVMFSARSGAAAKIRALWPLPAALAAILLADALWRASGLFEIARSAVEYEASHLLIGMSWLPALGFAACAFAAVRLLRGGQPPLSGSWGFDLALIACAAALGARAYDAFTAEASYAPYYAAPLVLLLALLHQRVGLRWPEAKRAVLAMLGAVAVGLFLYAQLALYPDESTAVHTPRGSFVTTPAAGPALQGAVDWVDSHTNPGEPILALPADAGLNFMTGRPTALHDVMFLPGLLDTRADQRAAITRLKAEGVRYAILGDRHFVGYGYRRFGVDYNRLLAGYVERHGPIATFSTPGPPATGTNPAHSYSVYRIGNR